jgi:hypothetical protein
VRANAARALACLQPLPAEAVAPLVAATADPDDGLRLNALLALRGAAPALVTAAFAQLLADPNRRIRLLAAGFLLEADPAHAPAAAAVTEALADPAPRLRRTALELLDALGPRAAAFRDRLKAQADRETEPELSDCLTRLLDRLDTPPPPAATPGPPLETILPMFLL